MPGQLSRRIRAQAPFLLVLAAVVAALAYLAIWPGHWRRGTAVIGVAMLLGAALRLLVSDPQAGLLAVRGRRRDALCYFAFGALIFLVDLRLHY